ncbi:hypothetical protein K488DRAFT_73921 [Vararia minispora EC-137]|uniref:Uncharacterized protein n=1 Tax=Vararia minispora EC-137 TaxID=1314806 RepID=A0ACB8QAF0_9AGAM|nr:hypothetical protein K488DRAFT_73921 [Vararia minispora EC-137]
MWPPAHPGGQPVPPGSGQYHGPHQAQSSHAHYAATPLQPIFLTPQAPAVALPSPGVFIPAPLPPTPAFGQVLLTPAPLPATLAVPFGGTASFATPYATPAVSLVNVTPIVTAAALAPVVSPCSPDTWPPTHRSAAIQIAPCLHPGDYSSDKPVIDWDVRQSPSTIRKYNLRGWPARLQDDATLWNAMAVFPDSAAREMLVVLHQGDSWREIGDVYVREQMGVRTRDLFEKIYKYFQEQLSESEYQRFIQDQPNGVHVLHSAAKQRCEVEGGIPEANWRKGYKRVDLLGGDVHWYGAWVLVDQATNRWTLHIGLVSRVRSSPRLSWS